MPAAAWQKWMPKIVDLWNGSANVAALSHAAYRAFDHLIMAEWQRPDGMLPNDDAFLQRASRLRPEEWRECRAEVLAMFRRSEDGQLYNERLFKEWNRAHEVYLKRSRKKPPLENQQLSLPQCGHSDSDSDSKAIARDPARQHRSPNPNHHRPNASLGVYYQAAEESRDVGPQGAGPDEVAKSYWLRVHKRSAAEFRANAPPWAFEMIRQQERVAV